MYQKTIAKSVELVGKGLHKGVPVKMVLRPCAPDTGIVFYRSDKDTSIELKPSNIINTQLATVLGIEGTDIKVSTIEHLLSAVHAYGIDNLIVELDNEEVPIMDGSAIGYCMLLDEAGVVEQDAKKSVLILKKPIEVKDGEKFVKVVPNDAMVFDFTIDFPHKSIGRQHFKFDFSTSGYKDEIARARTFGFLEEVNYLRSIGLAKGGDLNNCIVLDEGGVINKEGLRYKEEFVRHKILDAIGDMSILGMPLICSYMSYAGSHRLNHMLTEEILSDASAFEVVSDRADANAEAKVEALAYALAK